jgi:hypothetical protein
MPPPAPPPIPLPSPPPRHARRGSYKSNAVLGSESEGGSTSDASSGTRTSSSPVRKGKPASRFTASPALASDTPIVRRPALVPVDLDAVLHCLAVVLDHASSTAKGGSSWSQIAGTLSSSESSPVRQSSAPSVNRASQPSSIDVSGRSDMSSRGCAVVRLVGVDAHLILAVVHVSDDASQHTLSQISFYLVVYPVHSALCVCVCECRHCQNSALMHAAIVSMQSATLHSWCLHLYLLI